MRVSRPPLVKVEESGKGGMEENLPMRSYAPTAAKQGHSQVYCPYLSQLLGQNSVLGCEFTEFGLENRRKEMEHTHMSVTGNSYCSQRAAGAMGS